MSYTKIKAWPKRSPSLQDTILDSSAGYYSQISTLIALRLHCIVCSQYSFMYRCYLSNRLSNFCLILNVVTIIATIFELHSGVCGWFAHARGCPTERQNVCDLPGERGIPKGVGLGCAVRFLTLFMTKIGYFRYPDLWTDPLIQTCLKISTLKFRVIIVSAIFCLNDNDEN